MSVVGLHPEELLDKHAQNRLSAIEHTRLQAHVILCKTCRFELHARRDFALIELPHFTPAFTPRESATRTSEVRALRPKRRSTKRAAWPLSLAAALIGGASFAALANRIWLVPPPASGTPSISATAAGPAKPARTIAPIETRAAATSAAEIPVALAAPPVTTPVALAAPEGTTPVALATLAVAPPREPASVERSTKSTAVASALFHDANLARGTGQTERAIALYREVEVRFPRSDEAHVSYAILGSLLLDRGDARSALSTFDGYLSHGGAALGEEALVGRALSLQKLGATAEETAAWREVLNRFPKSVHARFARTRLTALGAP